MEQIMQEKADFILNNKELILDNLSIVKIDLFNILIKDESLHKMEEYQNICEQFKNKRNITNEIRDELYIIYSLSSFLDRISISEEIKSNYRTNLFRYVDFFHKNEKTKEKVMLKQASYCM